MRHLFRHRNCGYFSLVELLVVVAIMAVLMSLLFPSLKRTFFIAQVQQCSNNFKGLGIATMLYTEDNNDYYVNHNGVGEDRITYNNIDTLANGRSSKPMTVMLPYVGGTKEHYWSVVICPMVDNDILYGEQHGYRAPKYYSMYMPIQIYTDVGEFRGGELETKKMSRVGDTWNWGDSPESSAGEQGRWSSGPDEAIHYNYNILMADRLSGASHFGRHTATNHNPPEFPGELSILSPGGAAYRGYTMFEASAGYTYDANYLFDDGSVRYYDGIEHRPTEESEYLRFNRGGWVPVEAGEPY